MEWIHWKLQFGEGGNTHLSPQGVSGRRYPVIEFGDAGGVCVCVCACVPSILYCLAAVFAKVSLLWVETGVGAGRKLGACSTAE